ncbi:hypothetical protein SEA_SIXAMA_111 [Gordonia phage Sixama]|uniref:Uncharacterized protein n=1 Tax=Gordonia phage Sixama TaxID=2653271 RepID=A0A5Q2F0K2_9CAUD|nr:hypothetical protein PP302_gp111 [Gordonia phage Sixama]QGF20290.1 hypothetical protein SEA_SIXAMA_111 [Gordonia phage Sixama]
MTFFPEREADERDLRELVADGEAYIHGNTVIMYAFPIAYGVMTFIFGDALWGAGTVYDTAQNIPGAPQTWGAYTFICGLMILYGTRTKIKDRRALYILVGCGLQSIWSTFFALTFIIDCIDFATPLGATGALIHSTLLYFYANRFVLAWKTRYNPVDYRTLKRK